MFEPHSNKPAAAKASKTTTVEKAPANNAQRKGEKDGSEQESRAVQPALDLSLPAVGSDNSAPPGLKSSPGSRQRTSSMAKPAAGAARPLPFVLRSALDPAIAARELAPHRSARAGAQPVAAQQAIAPRAQAAQVVALGAPRRQFVLRSALDEQPNSAGTPAEDVALAVTEEEDLQAQPLQTKLTIGATDDPLEADADAVADQVMRTASAGSIRIGAGGGQGAIVQRACTDCDEEMSTTLLQRACAQRACADCDEEEVQAKGPTPSAPPKGFDTSLAQARTGGGEALPDSVRTFMEPRFGQDFSGVRLHRSSQAHDLTKQVRARAFTVGHDLFFRRGQFRPETNGGKRLIAHELTHVVQQRSGMRRVQRDIATATATATASEKQGDPLPHQNDAAPSILRREAAEEAPEEDEDLQARGEVAQLQEAVDQDEGEQTKSGIVQRRTAGEGSVPDPGAYVPPEPLPEINRPEAQGAEPIAPEQKEENIEVSDEASDAQVADSVPTSEVNEGAGAEAGQDAPAQERKPIDEETDESPAEEPIQMEAVLLQGDGEAGAAEECPPPDEVPEVEVVASPGSAAEDPAFSTMKGRAQNRASNQKQHESGEKKSLEANSAAERKPGEAQQDAQESHVGKIAARAATPPTFDRAAFIAAVLTEVEAKTPTSHKGVKKFVSQGDAGKIKSNVSGNVTDAQAATKDPLKNVTDAEPSAEGVTARQPTALQPEEPGARPGSIRADRAMPPPRTKSEMDMSKGTIESENILKEQCINRSFMEKHADPELQEGITAQDELKAHNEAAPGAYRQEEAATLATARGEASASGQASMNEMFAARGLKFSDVAGKQQTTKSDNEKKREAVAAEINTIFSTTKTDVTTRLTRIDTDVAAKFGALADAAVKNYEKYVRDRIFQYKLDKFLSDPIGYVADLFSGEEPPEVAAFYVEGRDRFIAEMTLAIGQVATIVETGLSEAKGLVETGKQAIKTKIDALSPELAQFKEDIGADIASRFVKLEGEIDEKQKAVVSAVADRYSSALDAVNALETKIKDENKSLVDKAKDKYNAVKDLILGAIEKLAALLGEAASRIIRAPGTFLKNLGAGIIQGFQMFAENIGDNIKGAVVQWLTGNMAGAGIKLPETFDLKGIIGFLLDIAGVGLVAIKKIARKVFGPAAMGLIEKGEAAFGKVSEIFGILKSEGPGGLLKFLQSEFAQMKEKIMGEIASALAEGLVVAGIKKAVGLLSGLVTGGAGTIVTIVATIIDVILWVKNNAAELAELASTVASMAMAIVGGQVGAVASAVNNVLKRLLPVVLGFVGALVGIAGTISKIRNIFQKIGKPARKAIQKLFLRFKAFVKKMLAKFKKKKGKGKDQDGKKLSKAEVKRKVMARLKVPAKAKDAAGALEEAKSQATALKSEFQPTLSKGTLKIDVVDKTAEDVREDSEVDMTVSLSPKAKVGKKLTGELFDPGPPSKFLRPDQFTAKTNADFEAAMTKYRKLTPPLPPFPQRRHKEPFSKIRDSMVLAVTNVTFELADKTIRRLGGPATSKLTELNLKDSLQEALNREFQREDNIFIGPGDEKGNKADLGDPPEQGMGRTLNQSERLLISMINEKPTKALLGKFEARVANVDNEADLSERAKELRRLISEGQSVALRLHLLLPKLTASIKPANQPLISTDLAVAEKALQRGINIRAAFQQHLPTLRQKLKSLKK